MMTNYAIWIPTLILVIARMLGVILVGPVFSHRAVPFKLRIMFGIVIALAVVARMQRPIFISHDSVGFLTAISAELLVGAGIGYAGQVLFAGIQFGAFQIANQMGLTLAEVFNPTSDEFGGVIRQVFSLLAVVIFLLIGGHRALIEAVVCTFEAVPLSPDGAWGSLLGMIVQILTGSFALALKVSAPVLITMLLATIGMGMLHKTFPQCHLLSTHLPIRVMLGLVVLAGSIAVLHPLVDQSVEYLIEQVSAFAKVNL